MPLPRRLVVPTRYYLFFQPFPLSFSFSTTPLSSSPVGRLHIRCFTGTTGFHRSLQIEKAKQSSPPPPPLLIVFLGRFSLPLFNALLVMFRLHLAASLRETGSIRETRNGIVPSPPSVLLRTSYTKTGWYVFRLPSVSLSPPLPPPPVSLRCTQNFESLPARMLYFAKPPPPSTPSPLTTVPPPLPVYSPP